MSPAWLDRLRDPGAWRRRAVATRGRRDRRAGPTLEPPQLHDRPSRTGLLEHGAMGRRAGARRASTIRRARWGDHQDHGAVRAWIRRARSGQLGGRARHPRRVALAWECDRRHTPRLAAVVGSRREHPSRGRPRACRGAYGASPAGIGPRRRRGAPIPLPRDGHPRAPVGRRSGGRRAVGDGRGRDRRGSQDSRHPAGSAPCPRFGPAEQGLRRACPA